MSIAQNEFWSKLIQSGLADADGCKKYATRFASSVVDPTMVDTEVLAAFLVQENIITSFQANQILHQVDPALRVGSFVMMSDQPVRPLTHWLPAQTAVAANTGAVRRGFLLRVPLDALSDSQRSWLAAHSEISADSLQPIELSGGAQSADTDNMVEIFSPLPDGAPLWQVLQSNPTLSARKTVRMGTDLAAALEALHRAGDVANPNPHGPTTHGPITHGPITHGAVGTDHVWITRKGNAVLLRDPSSPPRTPHQDQSTSWIERIDWPASFAAPELGDPAVAPSPSSDLYSLGCLLFRVLIGRNPFQGDSPAEVFAAHQNSVPAEIEQTVEMGSQGNPILRVLAYAMEKDPAARFDSCAAFAEALQKAGELVAKKPSRATKAEPAPQPPAKPQPPATDSQPPTTDKQPAPNKTPAIAKPATPSTTVASAKPPAPAKPPETAKSPASAKPPAPTKPPVAQPPPVTSKPTEPSQAETASTPARQNDSFSIPLQQPTSSANLVREKLPEQPSYRVEREEPFVAPPAAAPPRVRSDRPAAEEPSDKPPAEPTSAESTSETHQSSVKPVVETPPSDLTAPKQPAPSSSTQTAAAQPRRKRRRRKKPNSASCRDDGIADGDAGTGDRTSRPRRRNTQTSTQAATWNRRQCARRTRLATQC